ncbi:hypothetical protein ES702_01081 [subsurface metagenome]
MKMLGTQQRRSGILGSKDDCGLGSTYDYGWHDQYLGRSDARKLMQRKD